MTVETPAPAPPATGGGRAGRNLPAAIAVGVTLGALVLVTLFAVPVFFGCVVIPAAAGIGVWEVCRALGTSGARPALVPLLVGGPLTVLTAYAGGTEALFVALAVTALASLAWLLPDGAPGFVRDWAATVFTLVWVPFLAAFAALLTAPADGPRRVVTFIGLAVCSDIGGYVAGVLAGRHPMAPRVSPKKTWEGFAGSVATCVGVGGALVPLLFDGGAVWEGLLLGLAVCLTATVGDLGESLVKRDLGIKDMGALLPGHGGLMDRLDSLLVTAPVAWLLLTTFAPPP